MVRGGAVRGDAQGWCAWCAYWVACAMWCAPTWWGARTGCGAGTARGAPAPGWSGRPRRGTAGRTGPPSVGPAAVPPRWIARLCTERRWAGGGGRGLRPWGAAGAAGAHGAARCRDAWVSVGSWRVGELGGVGGCGVRCWVGAAVGRRGVSPWCGCAAWGTARVGQARVSGPWSASVRAAWGRGATVGPAGPAVRVRRMGCGAGCRSWCPRTRRVGCGVVPGPGFGGGGGAPVGRGGCGLIRRLVARLGPSPRAPEPPDGNAGGFPVPPSAPAVEALAPAGGRPGYRAAPAVGGPSRRGAQRSGAPAVGRPASPRLRITPPRRRPGPAMSADRPCRTGDLQPQFVRE